MRDGIGLMVLDKAILPGSLVDGARIVYSLTNEEFQHVVWCARLLKLWTLVYFLLVHRFASGAD